MRTRIMLAVALASVAGAATWAVWQHADAGSPSAATRAADSCSGIGNTAKRRRCVDAALQSQLNRDRSAHVNPGKIASMSLTGYPQPAKPGEPGCPTLDRIEDRERCFGDVLFQALDRSVPVNAAGRRPRGPLGAWLDALDMRAIEDAPLHDACHQAMHLVGYADGVRFARTNSPIIFPRRSTRLCHSGYAHGLVEGFMTHTDTFNLATIYRQLCNPKSAAVCAHGIGHSLMLQYQMKTAGKIPADGGMDKSILHCFDLPGPDAHPYARAYDCANGAYMQRAMQQPAVPARQFQEECHDQRSNGLRDFCYKYIAMNEFAHGSSARQAAAVCLKHAAGHERACAIGLGNLLGADRIEGCNSFDPELLRMCYVGAFILAVDIDEITTEQAPAKCETSTTVDRATCRAAMPLMRDAVEGLAQQDQD